MNTITKYLVEKLGYKVWEKRDENGKVVKQRIYINDIYATPFLEKVTTNPKGLRGKSVYYDILADEFVLNTYVGNSSISTINDFFECIRATAAEELGQAEEVIEVVEEEKVAETEDTTQKTTNVVSKMDKMVFERENKLYICEKMGYTSNGFEDSKIWEETINVPEIIKKETIGRGSGVIVDHKKELFMLSNTAGETSEKWFKYMGTGVHFEKLQEIPTGFQNGVQFLQEKYNLKAKILAKKSEEYCHVTIFLEGLSAADFTAKKHFTEEFENYEDIKQFFASDYDKYVRCDIRISREDNNELYNKILSASRRTITEYINIEDFYNVDSTANWKYGGAVI